MLVNFLEAQGFQKAAKLGSGPAISVDGQKVDGADMTCQSGDRVWVNVVDALWRVRWTDYTKKMVGSGSQGGGLRSAVDDNWLKM